MFFNSHLFQAPALMTNCIRNLFFEILVYKTVVITWNYFFNFFFLKIDLDFLPVVDLSQPSKVCCQGWTSQMLPGPPWQLQGCKKKCGGAHTQNTPSHPHFHIQEHCVLKILETFTYNAKKLDIFTL